MMKTILLISIILLLLNKIDCLCFPKKLWHIERRTLYYPDLEELAQALRRGLKHKFATIHAEVIEVPNLTEKPFYLASPGMTESPRIVDIGSLQNLIPHPNFNKTYSLVDIVSFAELNSAFVFGAGGGPFKQLGYNSEGFYNFNDNNCTLDQHSAAIRVISSIDGSSTYKLLDLNNSAIDVGLLGTLFASKGLPGQVVKLHLKKRLDDHFMLPVGLQTALKKFFGHDRPVAVGLIGLFQNGIAKTSVMPDFTTKAVTSFLDWVDYFNASAPFVMVGTVVSEDQGLDLYPPHIHFRSERQGGHFFNDLSPETVEYELFLSPAEYIYRVDQPQSKKSQ